MDKYKSSIKKYKEQTAKECYEIKIVGNQIPGIDDNKLGGIPYFPYNMDYPIDRNGNPLALLLQVNLKNINLKDFPNSGILEIFISKELDWPLESRIFLFKEGLGQKEILPEIDFENFIIPRPYKINFEKMVSHMPTSNYQSDDIMRNIVFDELGEKIESIYDIEGLDLKIPRACVGGYPDFTQDDPRCESDGRDECLFKLDSILHKDIYIGDCGILTVTLSKEDLRLGNLNNAVVDWDCC